MMSNLSAPTTRDLFADFPIQNVFAARHAKALADVAALTPELMLAGDLWRLRTELLETYRIRPLRPDWDARRAEACFLAENDRDAPETTVCVFVPFSGTPGLFDINATDDVVLRFGMLERDQHVNVSCETLIVDPQGETRALPSGDARAERLAVVANEREIRRLGGFDDTIRARIAASCSAGSSRRRC